MCDASLVEIHEGEPVAVGVPSSEPEWHREVVHRLASFRARRRAYLSGEAQPALPFDPASEESSAEGRANPHSGSLRAARPRRADSRRLNIEIAVVQRTLDFSGADESRLLAGTGAHPMASLDERFRAGLLDLVFLLFAYGGFLTLFGSLGGAFSFSKADALVYAATFFLLTAEYFGLFTSLCGATPGMWLCGLGVVSFDGAPPELRQLLWRSFGYVVSCGAGLLGFLWALWDEHHLTWHDRISQTYISSQEEAHTPRAPAADSGQA